MRNSLSLFILDGDYTNSFVKTRQFQMVKIKIDGPLLKHFWALIGFWHIWKTKLLLACSALPRVRLYSYICDSTFKVLLVN